MRLFSARRADMEAMRGFIEVTCETLPHADRQRLVLIVEELFCNSVEHGYGEDCDQPIWLTLAPGAEGCRLIYEDCASAHNPFAAVRDPMVDADLENRAVGGLGVFLVVQMSSSTRYERREDRNVIELFVPLFGA